MNNNNEDVAYISREIVRIAEEQFSQKLGRRVIVTWRFVHPPFVRMEDVSRVVEDVIGLKRGGISERTRRREVIVARQILILIVRDCDPGGRWSDLASFLNLDHSSVMYAHRKAATYRDTGDGYFLHYYNQVLNQVMAYEST